jgi:predicted TIM-barrel fold metal-dependent hydrolase
MALIIISFLRVGIDRSGLDSNGSSDHIGAIADEGDDTYKSDKDIYIPSKGSDEDMMPLFDAHSHLVPDFHEDFLSNMLESTELSGMAILGVEDSLYLQESYPGEFIAFAYAGKIGKYTTDDLRSQIISGANGIGELSVRHIATDKRKEKKHEADSSNLMEIYSMAAEYNVPINIHFDYSLSHINELENAISQNTNTIFIWAHMGDAQYDVVEGLMDQYDNLYADISSRNPYYERSYDLSDQRLDDMGVIKSEWKKLFEKHSDKFLFGLDLGPADRHENIEETIDYYRSILSQLNSDAEAKISYKNAHELFGIK